MPLQSLIAASVKPQSNIKVIWIIGIATLIFTITWQFPFAPVGVGINQYTPIHTILETISVVIASTIFAVGWQSRRLFGVTPMVLCAAGFLGVALLDVSHILSFKGMPDWVTHSGAGKGIYFWFVARYLAALSILILVAGKEYRTYKRGTDWWAVGAVATVVTITVWSVLYHQSELPVFLIVGKGLTTKKIVLEWLLIVSLFLIMIVTWRKRSHNILFDQKYILIALWLSILSELSFTLYSNVADIFSFMGHILKVTSYGFLYRAIVTGNLQLFNNYFVQSQTMIYQLVTHIQQVFWITTADNKQVLYVSPSYEKIWLQPCQKLLESSISWTESIHPDDRHKVKKNLSNLMEQDNTIEYRILRPDNSERWIRTRTFPFPDADGNTIRIAGVSEDITLKVNTAENLYNKERLLNQAQAITHLGSWEMDITSKTLYWSDEVYRIFGYQPQEFIPTYEKYLAGIFLEDRSKVEKYYNQSLTVENDSFEIEFRIVRHDNKMIRHVYEKYNHVRNAEGKIISTIGIIHDITEKKLADETKQQLELSYRNLVNSAPDAIIITNSQRTITLVNSQVEQVFGYQQQQLLNHSVEELISSRYHDIFTQTLLKIEQDPQARTQVFNMEIYGRKLNGEEFPMDVNLSSLESGGELQYTYILRDVSSRVNIEEERRQLQEQLAQAQKIEAIGHLTGGIAHDFNNILGAIIGYGSLLKDITKAKNNKNTTKEQAYVGQILIACTRAKELVAQMMAFSRLNPNIEDGAIPTILVQPVIKEVVQLLRSSIPSTISLNYDINNDVLKARIEPVKLHQILLNLAINSRDAIDSYGRISLVASKEKITDQNYCISCRERFSGDYLSLEIRDTGQGIPKEIVPKMFEPFFTTKEAGKGTGMGLSMVHGVVHSVGGHIKVETNVGLGTTISILLPAVPDEEINIQEQPILKPTVSSGLLSKLHIMIVDDEQSILFMLYELLTMYGAEVTVYNHPEDAIAAFKRNPDAIDLLITDQTMPDYSGLDMCREFLAIRSNLPVILCTGFSETVNASVAEQNGIAAFVYKPLEITQLLDIIHNVVLHDEKLLN